ncbi:hypothetical protein JZO66_14315 [Enterococcus sp. DIV0242_7C1]|uniref:Uncharacterized protein n=1 Tax=Candidatus Enterococcus dunnyi TaxID=1834192 RepID=A0A200JBM4_9ENTE|nr:MULTISPECIES: hypothetical protein [unclassified Enterococcus]MBO0471729.1 hypothetical protein [Enterococcus sp. DIV0242_7C1]OUZ34588.1 hypothetical protein A5889_000063 [Enterococcus sp. 9D6_DIV0238]
MHFITESDLRTHFRKEPFTHMTLAETERLTPGAKQFLQDKRIELVLTNKQSAKEKKERDTRSSLIAYQEILSAELLEAAILAKEKQIILGQKLLVLQKKIMTFFSNDCLGSEESIEPVKASLFQFDAIHIFSEQGLLLIKLKKIYGLITLISTENPQYESGLTAVAQELSVLVKQLVGDADE